MKLGWVYDRQFLDHDTGNVHVERPQRLKTIIEAARQSGLWDQLEPLGFSQASADQLSLVHEPAFVDLVRMMCDSGFRFIGSPDTCICERSYDVAALAAGGVLAACDAVFQGELKRAFCAVRPPGHHAEADEAMGFCLFNHVAIGAEHLIRNRGLARVAIVDFDAHHGNGTQHFFQSRQDVLYVSLHESGGYPGTGQAAEEGVADAVGYTMNIPLPRASGRESFLQSLRDTVIPKLDWFAPQLLLLSSGFDALAGDGTSGLALEPESYGPITGALVQVAERHADGRIVSVLEGGYDLGELGPAVVAHLAALLDPN